MLTPAAAMCILLSSSGSAFCSTSFSSVLSSGALSVAT